ncbi:MAG: 5'-3' exonuclease H3TH domain-containing protein [Lettuce witches'-broom phytoplasma]
MQHLILVDGNSLMFRAYYATAYSQKTPTLNSQGKNVNALMVFINMFEKILKKTHHHIFVAFDSPDKTQRHEIYGDYKKDRPTTPQDLIDQIDLIKEYLTLSGVKHHAQPTYEADDIIATLAKQASDKNIATTIYSSDKDFLQLIDENITVILIKQGLKKVVSYDIPKLWEEYQLKPAQIVDFKSLMGDSSDNIKGVSSVGPKTAIKLLNQFGNLENIYLNLEQLAPKLKDNLKKFQEKVFLNRFLITVNTLVPLTFDLKETELTTSKNALLIAFLQKHELKRIMLQKMKKEV